MKRLDSANNGTSLLFSSESSGRPSNPAAHEWVVTALTWVELVVRKFERPPPSANGAEPPTLSEEPPGSPSLPERAIAVAWQRMASLEQNAITAGRPLPITQLEANLSLSRAEGALIRLAMAQALEGKFRQRFSELAGDGQRRGLTVELALTLLCSDLNARLSLRRALAPQAALRTWEVLVLHDPSGRTPETGVLQSQLQLAERVVELLLDMASVEPRLLAVLVPHHLQATTFSNAGRALTSSRVLLPRHYQQHLQHLASAWGRQLAPFPLLVLQGRYGTGKRLAARQLAALFGRPLLAVSASALMSQNEPLELLLRLVEREALLTGSVVCWFHAEHLLDEPQRRGHQGVAFLECLEKGTVPTLLLLESHQLPSLLPFSRPLLSVSLSEPTREERLMHWRACLAGQPGTVDESCLETLASRYRLTLGQIEDAVVQCLREVHLEGSVENTQSLCIVSPQLERAARAQGVVQLDGLARLVSTPVDWQRLVLPPAQLEVLQTLVAMVKQRPQVYDTWRFGDHLVSGRGILALFAGPPGTGKTLAASALAEALGYELYVIDLSAVVSKYIGETEKNLERIFRAAEQGDVVLFFDEADALFGKRGEVKDANDRYANLEVGYLLQRVERFEGVVILASNLKGNLDEAYLRRMKAIVEFTLPGEAERLEIWRRSLPETVRAGDVVLETLARDYKLAGGYIRNIALTAAFIAADQGKPQVDRVSVERACRHEYQKMGKVGRGG